MSQWRRNVDDVRHMSMTVIEKGNGMGGGEFGLREEKEFLIHHSRKKNKNQKEQCMCWWTGPNGRHAQRLFSRSSVIWVI